MTMNEKSNTLHQSNSQIQVEDQNQSNTFDLTVNTVSVKEANKIMKGGFVINENEEVQATQMEAFQNVSTMLSDKKTKKI